MLCTRVLRPISEEVESRANERLEKTQIKELGKFCPQPVPHDSRRGGSRLRGYGIRDVAEIKIGDTLTLADSAAEEMLPGYKEVRPMVFSGLYPIDTSITRNSRKRGQTSSQRRPFTFQSETSVALGFGSCGFLGLCTWRSSKSGSRREYDIDLISTYPSVVYRVHLTAGGILEVDNPLELPDGDRGPENRGTHDSCPHSCP